MSSTSFSPRDAAPFSEVPKRRSGTWLWSLTIICFLFGGFAAMQINAQNRVQQRREKTAVQSLQMQNTMNTMQSRLKKEGVARVALQNRYKSLQAKMVAADGLSQNERKQLAAQLRDLQTLAGLSKVSGPGVVLTVSDNPDAGKTGDVMFGIVHDYDLLQIVNEMRNLGAEAISVNGRRVTAYSAIRCVGAPIYVNNEPVSSPFRIEAVGDADTIKSGLQMPGGIVEKLSAILPMRVKVSDELTLSAAETMPRIRHAKAN